MKKLVSLLLALAMLLSMVGIASAADEEPITVTVFRGEPSEGPADDNKIYIASSLIILELP